MKYVLLPPGFFLSLVATVIVWSTNLWLYWPILAIMMVLAGVLDEMKVQRHLRAMSMPSLEPGDPQAIERYLRLVQGVNA